MTLDQLQAVKQWHVGHRELQPVEYHTWDAVLTLWVMGWMGLPASLLLRQPIVVGACVLLFFVPGRYVALRRWLHRARRLRCDWLTSLR